MNTQEVYEDIKKGKEEIAKLKEEMRGKIKASFHKLMVVEIFDKYPEIITVGWEQYTPYFNDGEECTFDSNVDYCHINGKDEYGDGRWGHSITEEEENAVNVMGKSRTETWSSKESKYVPNPDYDKKYVTMVKAVKDFLDTFDNDDYRDMFGDHMSIVVTKDGVEAEYFEHD